MEKSLKMYKGKVLALVLDNAAYQRCAAGSEYAKEYGIGLIFLSAYSPNLNLIERFWKLVKAEVLNAACHGTFEEFKSVIDSYSCIVETKGKHKKKVSTLNIRKFSVIYRCLCPCRIMILSWLKEYG
jgi:transposase